MKKQKVDKAYVSDTDNFLASLDEKLPEKSESQQQEIEKHQEVFAKRDGIVSGNDERLKDF